MKVLVSYASKLGHTHKIASHVANLISNDGHQAVLLDCARTAQDTDLGAFHAVVVLSAVYKLEHHEKVIQFILRHGEALKRLPTAMISISLSVALDEGYDDAMGYAEILASTTRWRPSLTLLLGGGICIDHRDQVNPKIIEGVVAASAPTSTRMYEFTDWEFLESFVRSFMRLEFIGSPAQSQLMAASR
ncbi:MAG: flavodoxin domain-containing protein [Hyphomicrobium sp.]|jgi:menaquinone-dependent protoporphyrinogen oxidase